MKQDRWLAVLARTATQQSAGARKGYTKAGEQIAFRDAAAQRLCVRARYCLACKRRLARKLLSQDLPSTSKSIKEIATTSDS